MRARGVLFLAVVFGMACATPYQKMGYRGGYDDFRIGEDTVEVTFRGNAHTSRETVSRYLLRRASEVTLKNGYTHFAPLSETDHSAVYVYGNDGKVRSGVKPRLTMRIQCFRALQDDVPGLIDAQEFLEYNFPQALAPNHNESTRNEKRANQ